MSKESRKKKEKKQKPIYIDDGSTVYDMSGLDAARRRGFSQPNSTSAPQKASAPRGFKSRPKFMDCVRTYFDSVKLMLLPMLVVLGIIAAVFMLLWIVMYFAG